jgi:hypothetical protein
VSKEMVPKLTYKMETNEVLNHRKIYTPSFQSCISPCLSTLSPDKPAYKGLNVVIDTSDKR